ncbi:hypothetical protein CDAR_262011 [Caerostris darwini]|uniref:Maturase K n=1 Tax=Caerostris darwini TaxID=1538125 RepID=A0AAV4W0B8_9ARAC|nr:hypothetical protein CDAR_262011 [Caerostris darwini]
MHAWISLYSIVRRVLDSYLQYSENVRWILTSQHIVRMRKGLYLHSRWRMRARFCMSILRGRRDSEVLYYEKFSRDLLIVIWQDPHFTAY